MKHFSFILAATLAWSVNAQTTCVDPLACNFMELGECELLDAIGMPCVTEGCTNPIACNFLGVTLEDDGSCEFDCCPGPGCCGEGTIWNGEKCVVKQTNDTNFDLFVGLTDLLDVLSAYGLSFWECGDYLNLDGYEYRTLHIGSRCWCIENLKTEHFANGDPIIRAEDSDE